MYARVKFAISDNLPFAFIQSKHLIFCSKILDRSSRTLFWDLDHLFHVLKEQKIQKTNHQNFWRFVVQDWWICRHNDHFKQSQSSKTNLMKKVSIFIDFYLRTAINHIRASNFVLLLRKERSTVPYTRMNLYYTY